ncbi:MAG: ATPase [Chloroflexi bacterium]|nr:ATPase [Chloroflexota bacterium]
MRYYLGADLGSTKTHIAIADEAGQVVGFGRGGAANPQGVGYDGMLHALQQALQEALGQASIPETAVSGAGFGIAGYDWPSAKPAMTAVIAKLGLDCPIGLVNDASLALFAGAENSTGVSLVAGTGCNCRGWDQQRQREGRVTGFGYWMGEFAGASELVWRAMQLVAFEWTQRGPATALSPIFIEYAGADDLTDLLEGYTNGRYPIEAQAAPLIFKAARQGDQVATDLIRWAGVELGEMAKAVIRQLEFAERAFDVVLVGSMFAGGPMLIEPMWQTITQFAPQARLVRLAAPPVLGGIILGMNQGGLAVTPAVRRRLSVIRIP